MKLRSIQIKLQRGLKKNKKGGIEGLPLQLMIIIIIATLGTAILVGWVGNIETPSSIGDVDVNSGEIDLSHALTTTRDGYKIINDDVVITVYDQDGNPLEDAIVVLTGMGIQTTTDSTVHGTTDGSGMVTFSDFKLKSTSTVGFINVNVSKAGYGEDSSCRITVIA